MKLFAYVTVLLFTAKVEAQNLIPNGSFEQYVVCPTTANGLTGNCVGWYTPFGGADYFNSCQISPVGIPSNSAGYQYAADGNAYAGLYGSYNKSNFREYISTSFPPLEIGRTYEVSISLSLGNGSGCGVDDFGVFFYDKGLPAPLANKWLKVIPQVSYSNYGPITDTANWVRLTGAFTADSAYDNLVIGGFKDSASVKVQIIKPSLNGYYYIDSVVVRLLRIRIDSTSDVDCKNAGDLLSIYYSVLGNYFNPGNIFTLQLSDASGSFTNPYNIGLIQSVSSGVLKGVIPPNIPYGAHYRLRIASNNVPDYSLDNGKDLVLGVSVIAASNSPLCEKDTLKLTASTPDPGKTVFNWSGPLMFSSVFINPNINNATAANTGNYIVTTTLNDCTVQDTISVVVKPLPVVTVSVNSPVCVGDSLLLTAHSSIGNGSGYTWIGPNFNSTDQNPAILNVKKEHAGSYSVQVKADGCVSAPATVDIEVNDVPAFDLGADTIICNGQILKLGMEYPGSTYVWNTGSKECCISITDDGMYTERIANVCGTASDSISVHIISCNNCVFVPNTFTPNGDGVNDRFFSMAEGVKNIDRFLVYDRWGEQLYEAHNFPPNDPQYGWDGTYKGEQLNPGVYIYYLEARCLNGEKLFLKGDISLVK